MRLNLTRNMRFECSEIRPLVMESRQKLGVCSAARPVGCERLLNLNAEAWIPFLEGRAQFAIQYLGADLKQQVGSTRRPTHLLLHHEALGDHLVYRGFDEAGGNVLPMPVPLPIFADGAGIVVEVGREFIDRSRKLLEHDR
jgi:hypothetical protein